MADISSISNNVRYVDYASDYAEFTEIKKQIDELENGKFYRMELTDLRTRMDPSWYNYNGVSVFSSMAYEKLARLEDHMGLMSNVINSYTYNPQTPVYNMMHALKYLVNNETPNVLSDVYYTEAAKVGKYTAYKNKFYLPIAFCVNNAVRDWDYVEDKGVITNPFEVQGDFFSKATGLDTPFKQLETAYINYTNVNPFADDSGVIAFSKTTADTDASAMFSITTEKPGNVYLYYHVDGASDKDVVVNSSLGTITHNAGRDSLLDLGRYGEGETISVTIPFEANSGNMRFFAYTMDDEIFEEGYRILSDQALNILRFEDTLIDGTFTAKESGLLYTSIPYDKGWHITLDGKNLTDSDIVQVGGALIGVKAEKGSHEIQFKYVPVGLYAGIRISAISAFAVALYLLIVLINKKRGKAPRLPQFAPPFKGYTERLFLSEKKALILPAASSRKLGEVKKEIIYPPKPDLPKKEVFEPRTVPKSFTVTDEPDDYNVK